MYNKYVRGKNPFARCCEEFNNAEKNAIEFIEQTLIANGFNLSILYNCECVDGDGYFSYFKVELENIPQQLELFWKNFAKPIDKSKKVWYNINVPREEQKNKFLIKERKQKWTKQ